MTVLISIGALLIVLGVLVFVHELGHFVAAKAAGIYVHRFSLGLGSPVKALSFTRGETEYAVSWLPLGGYVKMATQEEGSTSSALEGATGTADVPPDRYFEAKPVWARMIVILAGVTMNVLFAWGAYTYLAAKFGVSENPELRVGHVVQEAIPAGGEALRDLAVGDSIVAVAGQPVVGWGEVQQRIQFASTDSVVIERAGKPPVVLHIHPDALQERSQAAAAVLPYQIAEIEQVVDSMPAARAGLAAGDTVLAIDSTPIRQWYDLRTLVSEHPGTPLRFRVARTGGPVELTVTPDTVVDTARGGEIRQVGQVGILVHQPIVRRRLSFGGAIREGFRQTLSSGTLVYRSVRGLLTARVSSRDVGGPILIGQLAGQQIRAGIDQFLAFMALISVNLAILNLLPIPVLDGGQFLFLVAEGVLRRPLSLQLRERLTALGLVLIILIMGLAFWNDLSRLFSAIWS